jgi:hypothetical protein
MNPACVLVGGRTPSCKPGHALVHPVIAYFWLCRGSGIPLPNVHGWRRLATIDQPPWRGEFLHSCSSAQSQHVACTSDRAPRTVLHPWSKSTAAVVGLVGASWGSKPLTQVRGMGCGGRQRQGSWPGLGQSRSLFPLVAPQHRQVVLGLGVTGRQGQDF